MVTGAGGHGSRGTSVPAAGPPAQRGGTGLGVWRAAWAAEAHAVLEDAAAMRRDPPGSRDAGISTYITPENTACACQHICQS